MRGMNGVGKVSADGDEAGAGQCIWQSLLVTAWFSMTKYTLPRTMLQQGVRRIFYWRDQLDTQLLAIFFRHRPFRHHLLNLLITKYTL